MEQPAGVTGRISTLVVSDHPAVRRELVQHLARSPRLIVTGVGINPAAIRDVSANVLVLDLSRVDGATLNELVGLAAERGARVIALASVYSPEDERLITRTGGEYRLKEFGQAGSGGLVDSVLATGDHPG